MASHDGVQTITLVAGEALTNGECVSISSGAAVQAAATDAIVGVCAESVGSGDSVPVAKLEGILEVLVGTGGITQDQIAVVVADGVAGVTGLTNIAVDNMGIGVALETGAAGEIVRVLAMPLLGSGT
jgi:hypothetical protein